MSFRSFIHLVLLPVFLFGSTFSCIAATNQSTQDGHHQEVREEKLPDDCCPKDGHKKEFENKSIAHAFKKQTLDIIPFVPQPDKLSYAEVSEETHTLLYYQEPSHDRQSTFFTDTIKLLLYRYISVLLPTCL